MFTEFGNILTEFGYTFTEFGFSIELGILTYRVWILNLIELGSKVGELACSPNRLSS